MKFYVALFGFASLIFTVLLNAENVSLEKVSGSEWRTPKAESVIVMQLDSGRVVIELAPQFAPNHVANIKQLVSDGYFDGSSIIRSQDNYVVQWGDPEEGSPQARSIGKARSKLKVEFFGDNSELNFEPIESRDAYAAEVGFVDGFPVASDGKRAWLAHCYGMVGVSRGMGDDSGNGSGLYVVTGHAPRHLDRNVTLVGRVIDGMSLLSSLPRGTGDLGFFESAEEYIPIKSMKLATSLGNKPVSQQIMNTNSAAFKEHIAKRTTRSEEWFLEPTGKIELCNVGVPSR
ncbi:MAG: peptidylprolyl isomerase [Arenicella sp.]|nr:peptidylprolyl isomerase [Arenicella sp.]